MSGSLLIEITKTIEITWFFHGGVEHLAPFKSRQNHCIGSSSRVIFECMLFVYQI